MKIEIHELSKDAFSTILKFILDSITDAQLLDLGLETSQCCDCTFNMEFNIINIFNVVSCDDVVTLKTLCSECKIPRTEFSHIIIM